MLALLILRRIVDPPDLGFPISAQIGVFVGLLGAIAVAIGGLVDSGREVVTAHPEMAFCAHRSASSGRPRRRRARRSLSTRVGPSGSGDGHGDVVDSTAEEVHS